MPEPAAPPWFAGRRGKLLVYRVNRRPYYEDTLLPETMPEDVFDHFVRVLAPGHAVVTGRGNQRTWRVGGVVIEWEERVLTGRLGWQPRGEEVIPEWSDDEKDWIAKSSIPKERRLMPFGFDGDSRLLTILTDGSSQPATIAAVFEKILRENEQELGQPTTEWSVEPVLDRHDFIDWLHSVEVLREVAFTARLPNPEPLDDFADLSARITRHHATQYTETMRSKREEGLINVEEDRDFRQAIVMGQQGFATLRGKGHNADGSLTTYTQKQTVAGEVIEELPSSWQEMRFVITGFLKERLRRFKDDRAAA